ncbi:MAG: magnesium/cobalt transporter CorA [Spirochaetales bacterium]|nr:magnesium/cobalt transporter CorA [Spirochaetales bacterium]
MKKKRIGHIPPGTLIPQKSSIVRVYEYRYNESDSHGRACTLASLSTEPSEESRWVSILGKPGDQDLEHIGERLNIHPMVLASIQKDSLHSRMIDQGDYIFITMPFFSLHIPPDDEPRIETRGVFFLLFPHMLVSIYCGKDNIFLPIEERLGNSQARIRKLKEDYLLYALLELLIEYSVDSIHLFRERTEELENDVFEARDPLSQVKTYRNTARTLRHLLVPFRELLTKLKNTESNILDDSLGIFYADLLDHGLRLLNDLDSINDHLTMITELHMSHLSNETNKVMKVLTIIASIFIPLSFIAGVYGMNFSHMPGLAWKFGYAFALGIMVLTAAGMILYFKWKKWL